jgi:hypothetical protein
MKREDVLVIRVEQSRPEVMSLWFPSYFWRTILKPIRECHVTVRQVKRIVSSHLGGYRVLLRKHKTHDLTEFDIVQEELDVYRIGRVLGWSIGLVVVEVILGDHLDIRVFNVDRHRPSKSNGDGSIACEQRPPNAFPESLVGFAKL